MLNRGDLLELDKLAGSTLIQLRTQNQELFHLLQDKVASERKAVVLSSFASSSKELRDALEKVDFFSGDHPERSLTEVVLDSLEAQHVGLELVREAADRIDELVRSALLIDPVSVTIPIRENPIFQQDLQQATVAKLASAVQLPEVTVDRVVAQVGSAAMIDDASLEALIKDQTLNDRQAKELGLTTSLFHIADQKFELAETLRKGQFTSVPGGKLTQVRDLIALRSEDWLKAIQSAKVQPPEGMDEGAYADELRRRTTQIFPTDALFARIPPTNAKQLMTSLRQLKRVLDTNPAAFGRPFDTLALKGINPQDIPVLRSAYEDLERLANLHPGLGITAILNDGTSSAQKVRAIAKRLDLVDRVSKLNPDTEFLSLDYAPESADVAALKFDGVSADEQRMVLSDFKAYQRAFAVTGDVDRAYAMLAGGYQSATSVVRDSFESFRRATGLEEAPARQYYEAAHTTVAEVTTATVSIIDAIKGGYDHLAVANIGPSIQDYLKKLDGYADLFGSQDYCHCEHCQSILSPAAYFVDLMRFVEEHVIDVFFTGPKRSHVLNLKVRRPDLWTLPLTCKNTDEVIPYLDIINEVLENYIAQRRGFGGNMSDRGAVEEFVYHQALSASADTFRQPFVLPLEKLNAYLAHFEHSRASVARTLAVPAPMLAQATLKISKRDYELITQANTDIAFLRSVYGIPFALPASGKIDPFNAQDMLAFTGLTRDDLGHLVETRLVATASTPAVAIKAEKTGSDSVQNDIERIHNLTTAVLDRMHRFARLWRHVPWSIPELDLVLAELAKVNLGHGMDEPSLRHLVEVLALQDRWSFPVDQNCALWSHIPRTELSGKESLFDRLFNLRPFVLLDGPLPKDTVKFVHPSFRQAGTPSPADNTLNRLLAGLQVSDEQLAQLITRLSGPLGVDLGTKNEKDRGFLLTVANLTVLYRHARLAQLLRLPIPDLFQLIRHAGISGGCVSSLGDLTALLEFHDWWRSSGLQLDDLGYITDGLVQHPETYPDKQAVATQIVADLQADKALQFADTVFAFLPEVTEDQSRRIIAANAAIVEPTPDGTGLRLRPTFNPTKPLAIPAGVAVEEPAARTAILKYHASEVLPPRLAGQLNVAVDKVTSLIAMTGVNISGADMVQALQGGAFAPLTDLLQKLFTLAILFRNGVFDHAALEFVRAHGAVFAITSFNHIGMASVRKLSVYVAFTDISKQASFTPIGVAVDPQAVQKVLADFDPAARFAKVDKQALAAAVHTNPALLSTLLPNVTLPATAPEALTMLGQCVGLASYLGVGGETLKLIISDEYADLSRAGQAVLSAFRAKYTDEKGFRDKLEPFEDLIRSRKRDALTDFLFRSMHPEFDSPSALYENLLVDVQLEGCARTSRLVAAISSVQLYVHRCLMNLEQDRRDPSHPNHIHVLSGSIPTDEWSWRKNYRVWEANRKVFLWPENYIEPELRDDKTPLFKDLESTLLQQQINEQNVLDAYGTYVSGFEEVARLQIAGSYHDKQGVLRDILHLFGVTPGDPPVYYYRTIENACGGETEAHRGIVYSPWRKISVQIPVRKVAPIVYLGRLFVFWVEITSSPKNEVKNGGSEFVGYKHKLALKYTTLRIDGTWTPPQSISIPHIRPFEDGEGVVPDLLYEQIPHYDKSESQHKEPIDGYTLRGFQWDQVYPGAHPVDALGLTGRNFLMRGDVDFYRNDLALGNNFIVHPSNIPRVLCSRTDSGQRRLYYGAQPTFLLDNYAQASAVSDQRRLDALKDPYNDWALPDSITPGLYIQAIANLEASTEIDVINGSLMDAILDTNGDLLLLQGSVRPDHNYLLKRLSTTLSEKLSRILFVAGVDGLLDIETQKNLQEAALPIGPLAHIENASNAGMLDFKGSMGTYYREMFFQIPFLIANHLSSQQRFAAAQRWYHYIFNPTANETISLPPDLPSTERAKRQRDRVWRYLEFRGLDVPRLRDVLTDPAAIEVYKKDPFNPHAIARLRLSAYQKCIVMKYIDNLLDWGDSLFSQFTMESVNEATLLYVMAADILGPRPVALGSCGEGAVSPRTYATIGPLVKKGSDFLAELETFIWSKTGVARARAKTKIPNKYALDLSTVKFYEQMATPLVRTQAAPGPLPHAWGLGNTELLPAEEGIARTDGWKEMRIGTWTSVKDRAIRVMDHDSPLIRDFGRIPRFSWSLVRQLSPVFCVPENKELLGYWSRVEDRLYKIRHCLDIAGVRRDLALFAPEVDPHLLVRARAAGISIEDVLNATSGNLPPYRFNYLIDKAKQYTASVQAFGAALLSALEKRDLEELNRLRTVQQQNLLKLTTRVREWEINIAADTTTTLERQQAAVQYRKDYYQGLIDTNLTTHEMIQQASRYAASGIYAAEATLAILGGVFHLLPQAGSPFALKYGGKESGDSLHRLAVAMGALADIAEAASAASGLQAGFERRKQGWQHQVDLADHELKQIEKQLAAANLRQEIAVRSLEIHNKTIEQVEEIFDFYNTRFTNLGRYTWLSTTLQRVYREAYNSAYTMARLAEQAYRFERGDDRTPLLQADYWDASNAGLLAGERLMMDLQNLERRFIETNYRTLEIDQSFSLTQINPAALIDLREMGACEFDIPEVFFDLFYPGQYRRKIRSVRLTIPCVTGPYTNVGATLTLTASKLRNETKLGAASLLDVPLRRNVSIATSTAQNDSGVFEFSFRDERYMPFEGSGAVSSWRLSLPKNFRQFDYQTINDVILHVSYTAEEDAVFREKVEQQNADVEGTILNYLSKNPLSRVFSLRQDFSNVLNRLLHSSVDTPVKFQITDKYIPIFLRGRIIEVTNAVLALKTPASQSVKGFQISIDGVKKPADPPPGDKAPPGFSQDPHMGDLWSINLGTLSAAGLLGEHTLVVKKAGDLAPDALPVGDSSALDSNKLFDVMVCVEFKVKAA